jgi:hypothetical protein
MSISTLLSENFYQLPYRVDHLRLQREIRNLEDGIWQQHHFQNMRSVPLVHRTTPTSTIDPIFEKLPYLSRILQEWDAPLGESRIMCLGAGVDVPEHVDMDYYWRHRLRVHIVVQSNPKAVFACGKSLVHLPEGEIWVSDSWQRHWVANRGEQDRIHIVIDTIGSGFLWNAIYHGWHSGLSHPPAPTASLPIIPVENTADVVLFTENHSNHMRTPSELFELIEEASRELPHTTWQQICHNTQLLYHTWKMVHAMHTDEKEKRSQLQLSIENYLHNIRHIPAIFQRNGISWQEIVHKQVLVSLYT